MSDTTETKPDLDSERVMVDLASRVRSRHCEAGGDREAYELAVWAIDLMPFYGHVQAWAEIAETTPPGEQEHDEVEADLFLAWKRFLHKRERRHG